jgi:hypothetical protein
MWVVILKRRDYLENVAINGELKCILKEEYWDVWTAFIWL